MTKCPNVCLAEKGAMHMHMPCNASSLSLTSWCQSLCWACQICCRVMLCRVIAPKFGHRPLSCNALIAHTSVRIAGVSAHPGQLLAPQSHIKGERGGLDKGDQAWPFDQAR